MITQAQHTAIEMSEMKEEMQKMKKVKIQNEYIIILWMS